MNTKLYIVNAFTQWEGWWNRAWVVFANNLSTEDKQQIAYHEKLSEIAFIEKWSHTDFKIEFFTPTQEVDLCGHATIGAFGLMIHLDKIISWTYTQETKAGILEVIVDKDEVFMEQCEPIYYDDNISPQEIYRSLNIEQDLLENLPLQIVSTGAKDILIPVSSIELLASIQPNHKEIARISNQYWVIWYHVFCLTPHDDCIAQCRNFAPLYGIPEESATWTSNAALIHYLNKYQPQIISSKLIKFKQWVEMWHTSIISIKLGDNLHQSIMVWWTIGQITCKNICK